MQTGQWKKGKYVYYSHDCGREGKAIYRKEAEIFALLEKAVEQSRFSPAFADNLKKMCRRVGEVRSQESDADLKVIEDRLRGLKEKKTRYFDLFGDEEIDRAMLTEKFAEINEDTKRLEGHRSSYSGQNDRLTIRICEAIDDLRDRPAAFLAAGDLAKKAEIIRTFAEEAVFDGDHVRIVWKKPYSFVMRPGLVGKEPRKALKMENPAPENPEAGVLVHPNLLGDRYSVLTMLSR